MAARWLGWATNEQVKTQVASKRLKQMADEASSKRLVSDPSRTYGRGFIWTGKDADFFGKSIANNLTERLAQMRNEQDDEDA